MTRTFKLKSYRVIQFGGFLKVQIAARNLADDLQKILQSKGSFKRRNRRGTIYVIYDFCRFAGVSPWYY